jgi:two-component system cell cycle sensor histidine kinase/response regulator CckA
LKSCGFPAMLAGSAPWAHLEGRVDDLKAISEELAGVDDLKSLLEGLFLHAPLSFQIYRADGRSLLVNPAFRRMFGSEPPPEYSVFDDDILERQGFTTLVRRAFDGETIALPPIWYDPRELRQLDVKEGRRVGVQVTMLPLRDRAGVVRYVAVSAKDVTSELELAEREERLRLAFSAGRMIAWDTNLTTRTIHVSDNAREVLGLLPHTPLATVEDTLAIIHPDDRADVAHAVAVANDGGGSPDRRFRVVRPVDGEVRWFERRATVSFDATTSSRWLRGLLVDVTARVAGEAALRTSEEALRRAEEQLRQSQKLEAIGRLAGGIAHDFNNILSVILSYGDLLLGDLAASDPRREDVVAIRRAGERAAELTRQLLAFSRQQVLTLAVLDLNDVVRSGEPMLRRLLGETIELAVRPARDVTSIRADAGQLEQVVMNLAINARDAMPDGGKLTIETRHVMLDEAYARQHLGVAPGPHVMLAVSDTGVGMDRDVQARIFEPFFTTKERGKGTGLGLSTVLGIVQQTGGSVWVYSEPGQGTTFKVFFPRAHAAPAAALPLLSAATLRGSELVLLVEDQDEVRVVAAEILRRQGYVVLEAASAEEALHASDASRRPIDLLLTDVVMPHMSGRELADRLTAMRTGLRVLFMSGYTEDAILQHRILESGFAYLQKPLVPEALARRVREVLDAPATVS